MFKKKYAVSITKAAKELGVRPTVIYNRLHKGWSLEKATTQPVRKWKNEKKQLSDKEVWGGCKKYKSYDECKWAHMKVFSDGEPKKRDIQNNFNSIGGWKIIYLDYVKKGECRFQALNTDGRFYQTNDPIEIHSILEEIFANLCGKN